jgi:Flp pilus assembly protein TadG
MRRHHPFQRLGPNRRGQTLVMFALLLPLLLGMVGLAIDGGLLLSTYRQTQNAADAAATAAAMDLINNLSIGTAQATGAKYVQTYNNMSGATVAINIPPLSGPHAGAGNTTYAEAIISYPYATSFIQLLGVNKNQTVTARAVAGYHPASPAGVMALLPGGPGINSSGGAVLNVDGPVVDNATSTTALNLSGGSSIYATKVSVSGGSSISGGASVQNYPSGGGTSPLTQNTGVNYADPLTNLAVPTTSSGVVNTNYGTLSGSPLTLQTSASPQALNISGGATATLLPGIYKSINISGGSNVTFQPGIYVLAGGGLTISGGTTVTGNGVMFYNTASTYNATTGVDGGGASYGSINLSGGTGFNLKGITNSSSAYNGMLVFQDRSNTLALSVSGGTTYTTAGTFYAPTASMSISGGSTFDSEFIVGSINFSGGSTTILPPTGTSSANVVFMVE